MFVKADIKRRLLKVLSIAFILSLLCYNVNDLWDKTPNRLLFTSYGVVLSLMAVCAILRRDDRLGFSESYWRMILGALLFGVSDNTLATLRFNGIHSDPGRSFIMLTYYAAQFLIYIGVNNKKYRK